MRRHPTTSLVPYLRNTLETDERAVVKQHLDACAQCRAIADQLTDALTLIAQRLDEEPAPDWNAYRRELRRKMAARTEMPRRWWRAAYAWGGLAAVTAIAGLVILVLIAQHKSLDQMPPPDQLALADTDVDMLRNYQIVERMDLLENYDVIEHLNELKPVAVQPDETRHL